MDITKKEHVGICKHRSNDECTHYQSGVHEGSIDYLKCDKSSWYILSSKNDWEKIEDWLVYYFIKTPVLIDTNIKMERKYDWKDVPDTVKYIATSESGVAFGYVGRPISGYLHSGFWYGGGDSIFILWPSENQFNSTNWRNSLEVRVDGCK